MRWIERAAVWHFEVVQWFGPASGSRGEKHEPTGCGHRSQPSRALAGGPGQMRGWLSQVSARNGGPRGLGPGDDWRASWPDQPRGRTRERADVQPVSRTGPAAGSRRTFFREPYAVRRYDAHAVRRTEPVDVE